MNVHVRISMTARMLVDNSECVIIKRKQPDANSKTNKKRRKTKRSNPEVLGHGVSEETEDDESQIFLYASVQFESFIGAFWSTNNTFISWNTLPTGRNQLHERKMKTLAAKVILVGNEGVGKTSLVLKFIDRNFSRMVTPTIGASLFKCCVNFNDTLINMQIWDTAGQERFRSMVPLYYRNVDAAFVVFDITRHYTFTVAKFWANELILKVDGRIVLTLIGNKKDLSKQRTVSLEEALYFANEIGAFYYESSVQEFQDVQEIFFNTAKELLRYSEHNRTPVASNERESIFVNQSLSKDNRRSACC